jgi:hypothetical protein
MKPISMIALSLAAPGIVSGRGGEGSGPGDSKRRFEVVPESLALPAFDDVTAGAELFGKDR